MASLRNSNRAADILQGMIDMVKAQTAVVPPGLVGNNPQISVDPCGPPEPDSVVKSFDWYLQQAEIELNAPEPKVRRTTIPRSEVHGLKGKEDDWTTSLSAMDPIR